MKEEETKEFLFNAFRDGELTESGTDITNIMPKMSRFGAGNRAEKKSTIIEKLKNFFEKYFGLIAYEENEIDSAEDLIKMPNEKEFDDMYMAAAVKEDKKYKT